MNLAELTDVIAALRETGDDTYNIEVKAAHRACPETLDETLSAFANMPDGGLLILGLDQGAGEFAAVGVWDAKKCTDAIGSKARKAIQPPIQLGSVDVIRFEGADIVACRIPSQPQEGRPYRVGRAGRAYTRSADGDYELSELEESLLKAERGQPRHDVEPVQSATLVDDIDPGLLEIYLSNHLMNAPRLRNMARDEQLIRSNVVDRATGHPTLAAVYALGISPQEHFPMLTIRASAAGPALTEGPRMTGLMSFAGPIPDLIDQAVAWVGQHSISSVIFTDGQGRDRPEYPVLVIRELVANALIHRDLTPASQSQFVTLNKRHDQLVLSNPGGLWGVSARELGRTAPRARNAALYAMCAALRTTDGRRIIEASATGIPAVLASLREAGMAPPYFDDRAVSFTAVVPHHALLAPDDIAWVSALPGASGLSVPQQHTLVSMRHGATVTNRGYRSEFPMDSVRARQDLQQLVELGLAVSTGQRGSTCYRLADDSDDASAAEPETAVYGDGELPAGAIARMRQADKVRVVVGALSAGGPKSTSELVEETGLTRAQISITLRHLRDDGVIEFTEPQRSKNQRYRLVR